MQINIAIDAMGGDHGPLVTIPAAVQFLGEAANCRALLVGRTTAIEAQLAKLGAGAEIGRASCRERV